MHRLIEKGLMFGNLVRVDSPILVERYNRALKHLTGRETKLDDFHIDISGFSPEVGDELGDELYLNHRGVNRQFILLTTEQAEAPLLNAKFSTSRSILQQFYAENQSELFALTTRDAVAGELINSVYDFEKPADLFEIRKVSIEADTTSRTVATAAKLGKLIDRFKTEPDAWHDDVLIAEMIGLAKQTGDVARNPVNLRQMEFAQDNFWTAHFGGMYIFRGVDHPAAIVAGNKSKAGDLPIPYTFDLSERARIAKFLNLNDLVVPITDAGKSRAAAILRQKMDFIVVSVAASMNEHLTGAVRRDIRVLGRKYAKLLPDAWHGLAALVRWAEDDGPWPKITSDHPAYFYTLRAARHTDSSLVNMLLAEMTPLDVRQLFICHKELFYRAYARWPDEKKAYVVDFLAREYQVDKAGTREVLFGDTPDMDVSSPARQQEDLVSRVGPWGAVSRRG